MSLPPNRISVASPDEMAEREDRAQTVSMSSQTRYVLIRFHEIALKGKNRSWFIRKLVQNVRRSAESLGIDQISVVGMFVILRLSWEANWDQMQVRLRGVFGIAKISLSVVAPRSLEGIKNIARTQLSQKRFSSFRISAHRTDKTFPLTSVDINRELGNFVQKISGAEVNLRHPEFDLEVNILRSAAYLSHEDITGPGGMPVGTGGKVLALLSGGIDSPVAAWRMLRRGCLVDFVHFHAFPLVDGVSKEKTRELVEMLNRFQFTARLWLIPFGALQQEVILAVPPAYRVLIYRRFMLRIADHLAHQTGALALITGESLGQVGSQTLSNLVGIRQVTKTPVFSPLIGMDKQEIVDVARILGTYSVSIIPDQDCCTLFIPKHPRTHSTPEELDAVEQNIDIPNLVLNAIANAEIETITRIRWE